MIIPSSYQWVVDKYPILSRQQEQDLFKQLEDSNPLVVKKARDTIFYSNLRMVFKVASNFKTRGYTNDIDDLISEGIFGLNRAIEKFDYKLGYKFSTYSFNWVRSFIHRRANLQSDPIRKPCHLRQQYNQIKKFIREYQAKHEGTTPTTARVAKELGITLEKVRTTARAMRSTTSIDRLVGENQDTTLIELLTDDRVATPNEVVEHSSLLESLDSLLDTLCPAHREVIELRYGLRGNSPMSLAKVGELLQVTRECIRLRENKALTALRSNSKTKELLDLYNT